MEAYRVDDLGREVALEELEAEILVDGVEAVLGGILRAAVEEVADVMEERGGNQLARRALGLGLGGGLQHVLAEGHRLAHVRRRSVRPERLEDLLDDLGAHRTIRARAMIEMRSTSS